MSGRDTLSREDIERAWRLAFTQSLDELPDGEIAWEERWWHQQGVPSVAEVCDALLAERRAGRSSSLVAPMQPT